MTTHDLANIIRNGENSGVEFKRDDVQAYDFARELVALLNLDGGSVLLGVEDDGSISGISRPNIEEWVMNACRNNIRPPVIPFYEVVREAAPGKDVALVSVSRGYAVQSVWRDSRHLYYIRVGSTSREPSPDELSRLFQQRGEFRAELRPINGTALTDLDMRRLVDYYKHVRGQDSPDPDDRDAWTRLLVNTEVMVEGGVTIAGMLLFGTNPNRYLPQAGIDATAYEGLDKDYAARERAALRGPITPLLDERDNTIESGLVEQAVAFVRRNTSVSAELIDGARREDRFDYPPEPVREAVVNALAHRDYLLYGSGIEISIYGDRVEIVSPGRLPNGITPERMKAGTRATRNQLLMDVMRDYRYVERSGMGVRRKIVQVMLEHNGKEPGLTEDGERFTVTLYK